MYMQGHPLYIQRKILRNRQYMKSYLSSSRTLMAIISMVVAVVVSFVTGIANFVIMAPHGDRITRIISDYLEELELDTTMEFSTDYSVNIGIGTVLLFVGLLIVYIKSRDKNINSTPKTGLNFLYAWGILELVAAIIVAVVVGFALLILGVVVLSFAVHEEGVPYFGLVITMAFVMLLSLCAICLVRGISAFRFSSSLRNCFDTDKLQIKGARTFTVISLLTAVPAVLGALVMIGFSLATDGDVLGIPSELVEVYDEIMVPSALWTLADSVANLISVICLARFMLGVRKYAEAAGPDSANVPELSEEMYAQAVTSSMNLYSVPTSIGIPTEGSSYTDPSNAVPPCCAQPEQAAGTDTKPDENPYAAKVDTPAVCPICGGNIQPTHMFCNNCGARLR
ncbi:MAG: zinc ribbon domain-containing protein [Ruminococcus sp.]|nr:zinc ribbon domain-containing protein [Ruminococcus sp.]